MKITMLKNGRFISEHLGGLVYYDARHRVIKTRLEDGKIAELVQERLENNSYRDQFLTIGGKLIERLSSGLTLSEGGKNIRTVMRAELLEDKTAH